MMRKVLAGVVAAVVSVGAVALHADAAQPPQRSVDMVITIRDFGPSSSGAYGICLDMPNGRSDCRGYRLDGRFGAPDRPAAVRDLVGRPWVADDLAESILQVAP
jgi:hypothetical protein